jgi:hypothetical protein
MASGTSRYQRAARQNREPTARTRISPVSSPSSVPGHISPSRAGRSSAARPVESPSWGLGRRPRLWHLRTASPPFCPPARHDPMAAVVTQNGLTWKRSGLGDDRAQAMKPAGCGRGPCGRWPRPAGLPWRDTGPFMWASRLVSEGISRNCTPAGGSPSCWPAGRTVLRSRTRPPRSATRRSTLSSQALSAVSIPGLAQRRTQLSTGVSGIPLW